MGKMHLLFFAMSILEIAQQMSSISQPIAILLLPPNSGMAQ
jgi:hypothetical protein